MAIEIGDNQVKASKVILTITAFLVAVVVVTCLVVMMPSALERHAGYQDVLQIELPDGVRCVNQQLNTSGRDRTWYDYRLLLQGNPDALLVYIKLLGLQEENPVIFAGTTNMHKVKKFDWWVPPSSENKPGYRLFEKRMGRAGAENASFLKTQVELYNDSLYLVQFGDIKSLKEKYESRRK